MLVMHWVDIAVGTLRGPCRFLGGTHENYVLEDYVLEDDVLVPGATLSSGG